MILLTFLVWLKELYSCYSAVTSLSSLQLYCREGEEHEECESCSCSLCSSSHSLRSTSFWDLGAFMGGPIAAIGMLFYWLMAISHSHFLLGTGGFRSLCSCSHSLHSSSHSLHSSSHSLCSCSHSSLWLYCGEGEERKECESRSCSLHSSSRSSSCSSHSSSCSSRSSSPFSHSTIFTLLLLHITSQALYTRECSHPSTPPPLHVPRCGQPAIMYCGELPSAPYKLIGWLTQDLEVPWCMHCLSSTYKLTVHPHALTVFRNEPGWLTEEVPCACIASSTGKTSRNRDTRTITKSTLSL